MKQNQFYKYCAIILFIFNLALISFFFIAKPPPPGLKNRQAKPVHEVMNLNKEQFKTFKKSARVHMKFMSEFDKGHNELLEKYFRMILEENPNQAEKDALLNALLASEKKKIEATYKHFEEVKMMIKPEQMPSYHQFLEEILSDIVLAQK